MVWTFILPCVEAPQVKAPDFRKSASLLSVAMSGVVPPVDVMPAPPVTDVTQLAQAIVLSADKSPPPVMGEVVFMLRPVPTTELESGDAESAKVNLSKPLSPVIEKAAPVVARVNVSVAESATGSLPRGASMVSNELPELPEVMVQSVLVEPPLSTQVTPVPMKLTVDLWVSPVPSS